MQNCGFNNLNQFYTALEISRAMMIPVGMNIKFWQSFLEKADSPAIKDSPLTHIALSYLLLADRLTKKYEKPQFNIHSCIVGDVQFEIKEETILDKPFCHLKHFRKVGIKEKLPKLLIVAPMAGHHATLLRETVRGMLSYTDLYITDWLDANIIDENLGKFDLDDYIDYLIEFIKLLGPNLHTMAVCQPTVPLLAAVSIISLEGEKDVPNSMILLGGPVDASANPTEVDRVALDNSLDWFRQMATSSVPANYSGYKRNVYPGALQLMGFMSLNPFRHINSHLDLLQNLLESKTEEVNRTVKFYDEYLATMDMTSEFYLQTIQEVFKDFSMAKNQFVSRGRHVDLKNITKSALLAIEGELDDIAAVGQTKAALDLCSNIPDEMKKYHLQKGAGHYGIFSGSKFKNFIAPIIRDFICQHQIHPKREGNSK